jgi:hypothetical protein
VTRFNEELVKAGVMEAGEGLQPSSKGARIRFSKDDKRSVVDGPFAETNELVAGYWLREKEQRLREQIAARKNPRRKEAS